MRHLNLDKMQREGWRVHIKTVKGRKYIEARRTIPGQRKRESRSLGPYNEKLWRELEVLGMTPAKRVKYVPGGDSSGVSLAGLQKQVNSLAQWQTRFSNDWVEWKKYPEEEMVKLGGKLRELEKKINRKGGRRKVKAENVIWTWKDDTENPTCTLAEYLELESASNIEEIFYMNEESKKNVKRFEELEERIDSCPISDIATRFVCPKCKSRGLVKVPIICSECGLQVVLGWYSTKEESG